MNDYTALRRLAEAATPGPWWHAKSISHRAVATLHRIPGTYVGFQSSVLIPDRDADAAYIAAASPDVVLALLDELAALREGRA